MQRYDLRVGHNHHQVITTPRLATALFETPRFALLWLAARVYLGWTWLDAGQGRLHDQRWMDGQTLHSAWAWGGGQQWYASLATALAIGQTLLGIALILGLFTGFSAFTGSLLYCRPVLAGSAAINPLVLTVAIALVLAWKTAGWIGLDRWILPLAFSQRAASSRTMAEVGDWRLEPTTTGARDAPG